MKKRIFALLLAVAALFVLASCQPSTPADDDEVSPSPATESQEPETPPVSEEPAGNVIDKDREGNPITLPDTIERIIVMGPSNTEVVAALGFADKIVAADTYSENVPGIPAGIPMFSMATPDNEQITALEPDVIFVTGMSKAGGDDPFKAVSDAGICLVYIPSSESLDGIKEDIRYLAAVLGAEETGEEIVSDMETQIAEIAEIGSTIIEKKNVYFEIGAAPYMYSFGTGVFLNEMIELVGGVNIMGDQARWISVTDESVLAANPDVILTSVNYIDEPVEEIMARPGWNAITAVQNGNVYYIDTDASNRPSHNVVKALREIALAVYPEVYAEG